MKKTQLTDRELSSIENLTRADHAITRELTHLNRRPQQRRQGARHRHPKKWRK